MINQKMIDIQEALLKETTITEFQKMKNIYDRRDIVQLGADLSLLGLKFADIQGDVLSVKINDPRKVVIVYGEKHLCPEIIQQQIKTIMNFKSQNKQLSILEEGIKLGLGVNNSVRADISTEDYFNALFLSKSNLFSKIKEKISSKSTENILDDRTLSGVEALLLRYPGLKLNFLLSLYVPDVLIYGIDSVQQNFSKGVSERSKDFIIDQRNRIFVDSILKITNQFQRKDMTNYYFSVVGATHLNYLFEELGSSEASVISVVPKEYFEKYFPTENSTGISSYYNLFMAVGQMVETCLEHLLAPFKQNNNLNMLGQSSAREAYLTSLLSNTIYNFESALNRGITEISFFCKKNNFDYSSYISIVHNLIIPAQINFYFQLLLLLQLNFQLSNLNGLLYLINRIEPRFYYYAGMQVSRNDQQKYNEYKQKYLESISDFIKTKWKDFQKMSEYELEDYQNLHLG